jgi:hypothetical protein
LTAALLGALAALAVAVSAVALGPRWAAHTDPAVGVGAIGLAWLAFGLGALCVARLPETVAAPLVVIGGLALLLAAAWGPPRSSDDLYRYIWDGRVQAAGIDPYRYAPADPHLADLRDDFLWPAHANWCVSESTVDALAGCTRINRPTVPTIYPPAAQALFWGVDELAPPEAGYAPVRSLAITSALGVTVLLMLSRGPQRAVLWAWCPTVALEAANNAHIDVVAALLTGAALLHLARPGPRTRGLAGGVLLGLAVATKITPVLVVPAVLRRRPVTVLLTAAGAVAVGYAPHVVAVGARVLGYLPGYLSEEGYDSGTRFALISMFAPGIWAAVVALGALAAVAFTVARTADPDRPWLGAATMVGAALLVTTPAYPWYALLLVLLVGLGARWWWLAVAAAAYVAQYHHELGLSAMLADRIGYGVALGVVATAWWSSVRRRSTTAWDSATAADRLPDTVET